VAFVGIVVGSVLLGAPAGLIWAHVAPHLTAEVGDQGPFVPNLSSTKAFIGADGSYLVVMLIVGILCGALAWRFARRSGPWTVLALVVGGVVAALIAASVGLRPGAHQAIAALREGSPFRGKVTFFLGRSTKDGLVLRAPWAAVAWPVGALVAFLVGALRRPEELD
jgi:membrane associated rhomboid family serine protease